MSIYDGGERPYDLGYDAGYREGYEAFRREMVEALEREAANCYHAGNAYESERQAAPYHADMDYALGLAERLAAGTFPPKPKEGT